MKRSFSEGLERLAKRSIHQSSRELLLAGRKFAFGRLKAILCDAHLAQCSFHIASSEPRSNGCNGSHIVADDALSTSIEDPKAMFAVLADNPSRTRAISGKVSTVFLESNHVGFRCRPLNKKSNLFHGFQAGFLSWPWQTMMAFQDLHEKSFGAFSILRPAAR